MTGNARNAMVCDMHYLQNEFGNPLFFTYLQVISHFLPAVKVLINSVRRKFWVRTSLKGLPHGILSYILTIDKIILN